MSVVAVRRVAEGWQIAADSIETWGNSFRRTTEKLITVPSAQFAIGGAGSSHLNSLMRAFIVGNKPANDHTSWLNFAAEFKQRATTFGYDMHDASFLAVYYGYAWRINGIHVQEVNEYDAIGAGRDFALTALYLGKSAVDACEITADLCHFTSRPIQVFTTNCYGKTK